MTKKIYYINRYDASKRKQIRENSGYEQIVKYDSRFITVTSNKSLSKLLIKLMGKNKPNDYITLTAWQEIKLFFLALLKKRPVLYLYADKDALFLPYLKKLLGLKRLKLYGTLHWPLQISENYGFYKYNLKSQFDGIVTLSETLSKERYNKVQVIPHGIDLNYWNVKNTSQFKNYYLVIGVSNRNHRKQISIINSILKFDATARFKILISHKKVRNQYSNITNAEIIAARINDDELKVLYSSAKGVILFQDYCLASNVVLESMAMGVPIIANNVGDISDYLGKDYPLYIDNTDDISKLESFIANESFRSEISNFLITKRNSFAWEQIAKRLVNFINS